MTKARLEEEIISRIESVITGTKTLRNNSITINYLGLDGSGGTSMEVAGSSHNLTRESVRQITNRVRAGVTELSSPFLLLEEALSVLSAMEPCTASYAENTLVEKGLISKGYKIEGIINAFDVFGLESKSSGLQIIKHNDIRFIASEKSADVMKDIQSKATKEISHNGAVSVESLMQEITSKDDAIKRSIVLSVIDSIEEATWIGDNKEWLYFSDRGRNRLVSRMKKIFSVIKSAQVSKIRSGIVRSWRKSEKEHSRVLPEQIILDLARTMPEFDVVGDLITVKEPFSKSEELRQVEEDMIFLIKHSKDGTCREKELEDALVAEESEKFNFSMALNYSPIFYRVKRGVYALVGTPL